MTSRHEPSQAPAAMGTGLAGELPRYSGSLLCPVERNVLQNLAEKGLRQLAAMPFRQSMDSAGMEWEYALMDRAGNPFPVGARVLQTVKLLQSQTPDRCLSTATGEYAAFNIEGNSPPILNRGPNFLALMHAQLMDQVRLFRAAAVANDAILVSGGILPSIRREHLANEFLTPRQRYRDLEAAVQHEHRIFPDTIDFRCTSPGRGEFAVLLDDAGLHIRSKRRGEILEPFLDTRQKIVPYNALDTSVQFHWGVKDQANYVRDHRIADLISAIMVGATANSPLVLGEMTGLKENRLFIYATMLHPRRVILSQSWLAHRLSQLEDALQRGTILGVRGSKVDGTQPSPLVALQLLLGSTWPLDRTVFTVHPDGTVELRIEHRPIPAQPTVADTMGAAALFYGLMAGMPDYLASKGIDMSEATSPAELEKRLPYPHVLSNVGRACVDGLQSRIIWFDGRRVDIHTLLVEELMPVAQTGLASMGISAEDRARYLGVIERRLGGQIADMRGVTPADVIRSLYLTGERHLQLSPAENCRRLSLWMGELLEPKGHDLHGIYDAFTELQARSYPGLN